MKYGSKIKKNKNIMKYINSPCSYWICYYWILLYCIKCYILIFYWEENDLLCCPLFCSFQCTSPALSSFNLILSILFSLTMLSMELFHFWVVYCPCNTLTFKMVMVFSTQLEGNDMGCKVCFSYILWAMAWASLWLIWSHRCTVWFCDA